VIIEDDMVADAVLWFFFAGIIGFIACGCHYTRLTANRFTAKHDD
jgi:hypothetical protein